MNVNLESMEKYIDHTLLKPDAGSEMINRLCEEARTFGFFSVCVNGVWVRRSVQALQDSGVKVAAVVGFPLGANTSAAKAFEAAEAVRHGAQEIDMVASIGGLLEGDYGLVQEDVREVVKAVEGQAIVKVILETGFLHPELIRTGCKLAEAGGAHFVKTSTGFGPGGATIEAVKIMRASVSAAVGVKASGGIRDYETARQMIAAGANRIGTSSGIAIVSGRLPDGPGAY